MADRLAESENQLEVENQWAGAEYLVLTHPGLSLE
jgi:hypothetical protein